MRERRKRKRTRPPVEESSECVKSEALRKWKKEEAEKYRQRVRKQKELNKRQRK